MRPVASEIALGPSQGMYRGPPSNLSKDDCLFLSHADRIWQKMAENGKHERLAAEIAGGSSVRDAAATVGMAERTAYRAAESPGFRRRVAEIRTEITDRAIGLLSEAATGAVQTLASLLTEENKPADRIAAAKAILSAVKPLSELGELRDRLDAIELAQAEAEARAAA